MNLMPRTMSPANIASMQGLVRMFLIVFLRRFLRLVSSLLDKAMTARMLNKGMTKADKSEIREVVVCKSSGSENIKEASGMEM